MPMKKATDLLRRPPNLGQNRPPGPTPWIEARLPCDSCFALECWRRAGPAEADDEVRIVENGIVGSRGDFG